MILAILERIGLNSADQAYEDIHDNLELTNDSISAINILLTKVTGRPASVIMLNTIKHYLSDGTDLDEDISTPLTVIGFKDNIERKYRRLFEYYEHSKVFVFETKMLSKANENGFYDEEFWKGLEGVCSKDGKLKDIARKSVQANIETDTSYYIAYNKNIFNRNEEEIYSYALISRINKDNALLIPSNLEVIPASFGPILFDYNRNVIYKQYYDIYNVISEWKRSTDLLTSFLKMYQIMEYCIFRKQFVDIVEISEIKQSFLRQIISLSKQDNERVTFKKYFNQVFTSFASCQASTNANTTLFIQKWFCKGGTAYINNTQPPNDFDRAIPNFIYDVRCSIVHNKEAEFHITLYNYDEYEPIVPLMKAIIEEFKKQIFGLINNDANAIVYNKKSLALY